MKTTSLMLATALALVLAAPAHAQFQERTLRVSNTVTEIHAVGEGLAAMDACLAERSDGKLKLQPFWGGALGSDGQATQALRSGTLEMVTTATSSLGGITAKAGLFDLPYLVNSEAEAYALMDGPVGDVLNAELEAAGLINLGYWENGFRHVTMSHEPITRWEDLSGRKMRVLPSPTHIAIFEAMGATALPMSFGEVIAALETGAMDGQDNTLVNIDTLKINDVQDYLSLTGHMYNPLPLLYSKPLFDQLSADEQQAVRECAIVGRDVQREASQRMGAEAIDNVVAQGMNVNEISPEELERFVEQTSSVYEQMADTIGADYIDEARAEIERIRATN